MIPNSQLNTSICENLLQNSTLPPPKIQKLIEIEREMSILDQVKIVKITE